MSKKYVLYSIIVILATAISYPLLTTVCIASGIKETKDCIINGVDSLSVNNMLNSNLNSGEAYIWYLLHSGFAVKTKSKLLIFDYVQTYNNIYETSDVKSLSNGWINPKEIENLDVYIFVSHAHKDHFDKSILEWEHEIKNITYIFGWLAGDDSNHIYLSHPHIDTSINGIKIYTTNSYHGGIPESSFLLKADGLTIYHSGDCRDNIKEEMAWIKPLAGNVDIAFQYDIDIEDTLNEFVIHPLLELRPNVAFPMHLGHEEYNYPKSCERWINAGFSGICICPKRRGSSFFYRKISSDKKS